MDPEFWLARWQKQEIGFHQASVLDLLQAHWARLGLERGAPVFVPLCGKSLDMAWLAGEGYRVIGAELSEIAIDEFFAERGLKPTTRTVGRFAVKSAEAYELWCGDIFELPREAVAGVAGVYDRAALIAFPPAMQERYAATLKSLLPARAPILLITSRLRPHAHAGTAVRNPARASAPSFRRQLRSRGDRLPLRARAEPPLQRARPGGAGGMRLSAKAC